MLELFLNQPTQYNYIMHRYLQLLAMHPSLYLFSLSCLSLLPVELATSN